MKKGLAGLIIAAVILTLVVPIAGIWAADVNQPKEPNAPAKAAAITVKGKILIAKDAKGNITSVKIMGDKAVVYEITMDAKGKELGEKMAHKMVEVTGVSAVKAGTKWLTVEKYTESQKSDTNPPPKHKKPGRKQ